MSCRSASARGHFEDRVQAGRDPGDVPPLAAQGGSQAVAAAAVGEPGPADLPVVAAGVDELGQDELVQPRGARGELGRYRVQQPRRDDQPAEPQRRRQALARRAGVDDVIGRERLQRAHRLPVIAELAVVVVLDHHPAPAGRLPAAAGMQGHAQRELMRRGQQRGVRPGRVADHGAAAVHGQRTQSQALGLREVAVGLVAVGLHGQCGRAGRAQRGAGDGQAVREARADHDAARVGGHAPGPRQVARQHRPQLRQPARVRVVQQLAGSGGEHLPGRGQPGAGGEGGQVRDAGTQVVAGRRPPRGGPAGPGAGSAARRSATEVPEPVRAVSHPSATSWL